MPVRSGGQVRVPTSGTELDARHSLTGINKKALLYYYNSFSLQTLIVQSFVDHKHLIMNNMHSTIPRISLTNQCFVGASLSYIFCSLAWYINRPLLIVKREQMNSQSAKTTTLLQCANFLSDLLQHNASLR